MLPDSGWINALKLPTKVIGGLSLSSAALLLLDHFGLFDLSVFGGLAKPVVVVVFVVFGCLLVATAIEVVAGPRAAKKQSAILAERRQQRSKEKEDQRAASQEKAIAALDHLSGWELKYVADALREGSPSFYTYVHSPPVAQLMAKNLVFTPGGTHHQDHYPFTFRDFIWDAMKKQKDELIAKSDAFEAREAEKKRRGR